MHHKNLRNFQTFQGGFTDLYILGTKRANGAAPSYTPTSDFTAAATTQTFILQALAVGDVVVYPRAQCWVKQKFTDHATEDTAATTLANLKADIGYTGATTAFIAGTNADLQQAVNSPTTGQAAGGGGYAHKTGTVNLLATLTSTAGNLSTITYGELYIYLALARVGEWVRDRQG